MKEILTKIIQGDYKDVLKTIDDNSIKREHAYNFTHSG